MDLTSIPLSDALKAINPRWIKLRDSFLLGEQVPCQRDLENLIIDLLPGLNAMEQEGRIFSAWSLETIFLDTHHRAHLLPGYSTPLEKQHAPESLYVGFAALEQYTLHASYPLGTHTDVYGLAMVLRAIILRLIPSPAIDRLEQEIEPISNINPPGFSRLFLRTLDHASVLQYTERLKTMQEWAQMLNLVGPTPEDLIDRLHINYAHLLQQQYILLQQQASKNAFFDRDNVQPKRLYSYRAPQAPVFSSPYQARQNTGLILGHQEPIIKDISPAQTPSTIEQALTDKEWTQQRKRSASMVPVNAQNKTTSRSARKPQAQTKRQGPRWGMPILLANIVIACTSIYFVVFHQSSAPEQVIAQAELTAAEQQERDRVLAAQRQQEQEIAAQRQRELAAAEQQERDRVLAAQRQQEQEIAAQRQREFAVAEQQERDRALAAQRQRELAEAEQRQRELAQAE